MQVKTNTESELTDTAIQRSTTHKFCRSLVSSGLPKPCPSERAWALGILRGQTQELGGRDRKTDPSETGRQRSPTTSTQHPDLSPNINIAGSLHTGNGRMGAVVYLTLWHFVWKVNRTWWRRSHHLPSNKVVTIMDNVFTAFCELWLDQRAMLSQVNMWRRSAPE